MQTMRPISAAMASSMEAAATDGGTNIALRVSRISYSASLSTTMSFPYNRLGIIHEGSLSAGFLRGDWGGITWHPL